MDRLIGNENDGTYWDHENILYPNCGGDYRGVYICTFVKDPENCILKYVNFTV